MSLLKALVVTGSGSLVTMSLGAITTKIIAVISGPAGIGLYAQLRQIVQLFVTLATLNGQSSLVRGIASRDGSEQSQFVGVVGKVFLTGALLAAGMIVVFAPSITWAVFAERDGSLVLAVRLGAVAVLLGAMATFILGVINGYREIKLLALIQVAASIATVSLAYPLARTGEPLAYVSIVGVGFLTVTGFGIWWLVRHRSSVAGNWSRELPSLRYVLKDHVTYSITTLITGLAGIGLVLAIRSIYIRVGGLEAGGYFDAAWTLSMMYVMLILSSFGTYYFPTLSSKKTDEDVNECVNQVLHIAVLSGTVLVSFVVVAKPILIHLLYSSEFQPTLEILRWMLLGDYLKITSWVFGMLLLAFAERRRFLISELLWQGVMIGMVVSLIERTMESAGIAFLIVNAFYLSYVWQHAVRQYRVRVERRLIRLWIFGLLVVSGLSALTWQEEWLGMPYTMLVWAVVMVLFFGIASNNAERSMALSWVRARIAKG